MCTAAVLSLLIMKWCVVLVLRGNLVSFYLVESYDDMPLRNKRWETYVLCSEHKTGGFAQCWNAMRHKQTSYLVDGTISFLQSAT
ncbi:hypothetical protein F4781DRAFT_416483 [Annulohypoxylon bovei var. microspora]|nr:hypothetical protein F4781DRAFT_416483 [Annulohypoxylon bovei var. microspora]